MSWAQFHVDNEGEKEEKKREKKEDRKKEKKINENSFELVPCAPSFFFSLAFARQRVPFLFSASSSPRLTAKVNVEQLELCFALLCSALEGQRHH